MNKTITAMKLQSNFIISITNEAERRYLKNWKIPTDKNKSRIVVYKLDYHYQPNTYR